MSKSHVGVLIDEEGAMSVVLLADSELERVNASRLYTQIEQDVSVFEYLVRRRLRSEKPCAGNLEE